MLMVDDVEYQLVIWDLEGRDEFTDVRSNYLRGAAGVFFRGGCHPPPTPSPWRASCVTKYKNMWVTYPR